MCTDKIHQIYFIAPPQGKLLFNHVRSFRHFVGSGKRTPAPQRGPLIVREDLNAANIKWTKEADGVMIGEPKMLNRNRSDVSAN